MAIGAAILTALGALGAIGSTVGSVFSQKKANETNLKIAREANQHEVDMWNMANAYNSPTEQMKRYQEAGLNPRLMYGSGNVGNASKPPTVHKSSVESVFKGIDNPILAPALQQYMQIKETKARTDNIQADTEIKEQRVINEGIRNGILTVENLTKNLDYKKKSKLFDTQVSVAESQLEKVKQDVMKLKIETERSRISKEMEETLKKYNLTPSDNVMLRLMLSNEKHDWIKFDPEKKLNNLKLNFKN